MPHMHRDEMMYRDQVSESWHRMSGNWHIFKGRLRQRWGEFTHEDLDHLAGGFYEELAGKIQKVYGISKEEADQQIKEWLMTDHDPHFWSTSGSDYSDI